MSDMVVVGQGTRDRDLVRQLYKIHGSAYKVGQLLNIPYATIYRWCKDLKAEFRQSRQGLASKPRPDKYSTERRQVRDLYMEHGSAYAVAKLTGFCATTVRRWCVDLVERHRKPKPAAKIRIPRVDMSTQKTRARELYQQGKSYSEIRVELGVALSSVSKWCKDLIPADKQKTLKVFHIPDNFVQDVRELYKGGMTIVGIAAKYGTGPKRITTICKDLIPDQWRKKRVNIRTRPSTKMTDQQVIDMRNEVRASGDPRYAHYAEVYESSLSFINKAQKGQLFKHLNEQCPPVFARLKKVSRGERELAQLMELLGEALALHKSDPVRWNRDTLAVWMNDRSGKKYKPHNVKTLLLRLDPSLTTLEAVPVKRVRRRKNKRPNGYSPRYFSARPQPVVPRAMTLEEMLAAEDEYELSTTG
jgi:DNA invertase Pin-like site-specific DNA recombinase